MQNFLNIIVLSFFLSPQFVFSLGHQSCFFQPKQRTQSERKIGKDGLLVCSEIIKTNREKKRELLKIDQQNKQKKIELVFKYRILLQTRQINLDEISQSKSLSLRIDGDIKELLEQIRSIKDTDKLGSVEEQTDLPLDTSSYFIKRRIEILEKEYETLIAKDNLERQHLNLLEQRSDLIEETLKPFRDEGEPLILDASLNSHKNLLLDMQFSQLKEEKEGRSNFKEKFPYNDFDLSEKEEEWIDRFKENLSSLPLSESLFLKKRYIEILSEQAKILEKVGMLEMQYLDLVEQEASLVEEEEGINNFKEKFSLSGGIFHRRFIEETEKLGSIGEQTDLSLKESLSFITGELEIMCKKAELIKKIDMLEAQFLNLLEERGSRVEEDNLEKEITDLLKEAVALTEKENLKKAWAVLEQAGSLIEEDLQALRDKYGDVYEARLLAVLHNVPRNEDQHPEWDTNIENDIPRNKEPKTEWDTNIENDIPRNKEPKTEWDTNVKNDTLLCFSA